MRLFSNRALLVSAAAAVTFLQGGIVAAQADEPTWTVSAGGRTTAYNTVPIHFIDQTSGVAGSCSTSELIVRFRSGTGLPGTSLIMITYGTLGSGPGDSSCTGTGGVGIEIHPRGLPWKMNATSYDPQTGTTTGTMSSTDAAGIGAVVNVSTGCEMTVGGPGTAKGEIETTYTNSTGRLRFTDTNLVIKSVSPSCSVSAGDEVWLAAEYLVMPQQTITSP